MSRTAIAVPLGLLGFLAYVLVVITVAERVHGGHWLLELAYFAAAGMAWVLPAYRLILWVAADPRQRPRAG